MSSTPSIPPAYLLVGPETGKKGTFIKQLQKKCSDRWGDSVEFHRFYPFETDGGQALEVLRNCSLFAEFRIVMISQAEQLNQEMVKAVTDYLASPSPDALLILASSENRVHAKIHTGVGKEHTVMFWELFENEKVQWLEDLFASRDMDISRDGIDLFLDLVENNTQEMRSAAGLFISYLESLQIPAPVRIGVAEVESFVYHSKQENVFTLFAKLVLRDFPGTLEICEAMRLAGALIPAPFFAGLLWQFRRLLSLKELMNQRWLPDEALMKTMVLGKKAPVKGKMNQRVYLTGCERFSIQEIRRCITAIQEYEAQTRDMRAELHPLLIELLLYRITCKGGQIFTPGAYSFGLAGLNLPPL